MKFFTIICTTLFSTIGMVTTGQDRGWDWAIQFFGNKYDLGYDLAVDNQNNYYVTGIFYDDITIGDTTLHKYPGSTSDAFLTKLSPDGNILWVHHIRGISANSSIGYTRVAVDSLDNIYIAGNFSFTMKIVDTVLISLGNKDIFISKFNADGDFLKLTTIKGPVPDEFFNQMYWHNGLYLGVKHNGYVSTNAYAIYGNTDTLFFKGGCYVLAKFDDDLDFKWHHSLSSISPYFSEQNIEIGLDGYPYMRAVFRDSIIFQDTVVYPEYYFANLIQKLDTDGNRLWMKQLPKMFIRDYKFDQSGNMFCVIQISSIDTQLVIGNDRIPPISSGTNMIVAKFDPEMSNLWYFIVDDNYAEGRVIEVLQSGNFLLGGVFRSILNLGDTSFSSTNTQSYVAEFDNDGNFQGAFRTQGDAPGLYYGINVFDIISDQCDNIILTGTFNGISYFGTDTLFGEPIGDVFIARYLYSDFSISLGSDTTVCGSITLTPDYNFATYLWSDGSTEPFLLVEESGQYAVTVTDELGCKASDEIFVTIIPNPVVELGSDTTITFSDTLRLLVIPGYDYYQWQDGSAANYFDIIGSQFDEGIYLFWVNVESDGCLASDSIWVTIKEKLGYSEIKLASFILFPNPAKEVVFLQINNPTHESGHLHVYDLYGNELKSLEVITNNESQPLRIPVSNLKPGIYILKLSAAEIDQYQKLIISR
ncbi:MAG: T9SS type A sorting domain-containing protein [Bacteroidales bacterium]